MPEPEHRAPLTLENLLHLKRAERPSPEFWTRFETELRQKQLAALIDRRPWWQTLPQLLARRRAIIPLGATAILALTLVSIKFHTPGHIAQVAPVSSEASAPSSQFAGASVTVPVPVLAESGKIVSSSPSASDLPVDSVIVAAVPLSANLPEHASELTPWSASRPAQSPNTPLFASNTEQPERADLRLTRTLSSNAASPDSNRVQRSGGAVAELASVSALASKRTRLLAQFGDRQFTPEPQAPAIVRERLTRRLADATGANDHFTRVGLKGDQVSLRF